MSRRDKLEHFAVIGSVIADDDRVTASQLLVFTAIAFFADKNGIAYPSQKAIAKKSKLKKRAIIEATKHLEELGYLKVTREKKENSKENKVNKYQIIDNPNNVQGSAFKTPRSASDALGVVHQMHSNNTNTTIPINNKNIYNSDIKNIASRVIDYINLNAGTYFEVNNLITQYIKTLLDNHFTEKDILRVIDNRISKTNSLDIEPLKILNLNYFKKLHEELNKKKVVVPIIKSEM